MFFFKKHLCAVSMAGAALHVKHVCKTISTVKHSQTHKKVALSDGSDHDIILLPCSANFSRLKDQLCI